MFRSNENKKWFGNILVLIALVVIVWCIVVAEAVAREPNGGDILNKMSSLQVPFVENQGQIKDENVKYYARTFGGTVFVLKDGNLVYSFPKFRKGKRAEGWVIKETFVGSSISTVQGESSSITEVNYFKGKDPSKWKTNVSTYEFVSLGEVYSGIELRLKGQGDNVEKVFRVKPNANLETIKVKVEGAKSIKVNEEEELEVETGVGVVKFTKPVAYQQENGKRKYVEVAYTVKGDEYGFQVGSYDRTKELLIDPLLGSTFVGGSSSEMGIEIEVDDSGNVYISGVTMSSDFPTTPGTFDTSHNGGFTDIFITKLSSTGDIIYSTFIGGSSNDYDFDDWYEAYVFGMAIDSSGNIYVTGETFSSDFPTTSGAFDTTFDGSTDAFVTKLNSSGDALVYSTFLGGSYDDAGAGIVVDSLGNAYVTGETKSPDFPTTSGAFDTTYNGHDPQHGDSDIFVARLNSTGSNIVFSTFIGGRSWDEACDIALHPAGSVYVVGGGGSSDFPTTPDAFDRSFNGGEHDIYIAKLNATGSNLIASTFLGGSAREWSGGIAIASSGNIFLSGGTASTDYPTTPDAYNSIFQGNHEVDYKPGFVTKLDPGLSSLLASTFIAAGVGGHSICLDNSANVYISGAVWSDGYPTTPGAYDNSFNGGEFDVFVGKFNNSLSSLLASTLIGGSSDEYAIDLALDSSGNVLITGGTGSCDYPVVMDANDYSHNGGMDAFVSKLDPNLSKQQSPWRTETPISIARNQFTGGVIDGKIYVFGGNGNPNDINLKSTEMFDPVTNLWSYRASNEHNDGHGVEELTGAVVNGELYVFGAYGGIGPDGFYGDFNFVERYDPDTDRWTSLAPKPAVVTAAPAAVYSGEIYLFGGGYSYTDDNGTRHATDYDIVEAYNPANDTWRFVTNMPKLLSSAAVAVTDQKAYVIGGYSLSESRMLADIMVFDFQTGQWTEAGFEPLPCARAFPYSSAAPIVDGKIYLIGGCLGDEENHWTTDRVDIYDTATNTWHIGQSLPEPRDDHLSVLLGNRIYVIGGCSEFERANRSKSEVISLNLSVVITSDFCGASSDQPDEYVDYWDLLHFAQRWHTRSGEGNWDPRCDLTSKDSGVKDNYVDYWDLLVFAQQWHKGQKPP